MFTNDCCIIVKYLQGSAKTFLTGSSLAIFRISRAFSEQFWSKWFVSYMVYAFKLHSQEGDIFKHIHATVHTHSTVLQASSCNTSSCIFMSFIFFHVYRPCWMWSLTKDG